MDNKLKLLVTVVAIILALSAGYTYMSKNEDTITNSSIENNGVDEILNSQGGNNLTESDESTNTDNSLSDDELNDPEDNTGPESNGTYSEYSSKTILGDNTVLFFHAGWCPTCSVLDNDINQSLNDIPADVNLVKVDFDTENDLRSRYGVNVQHTLIRLDADGNELTRVLGSNTLEDALSALDY